MGIKNLRIVTVTDMQFGFMLEKGTIDAVFILIRFQEEYCSNGEICIYLREVFNRVPSRVLLWAMRKNGILDVLVISVMHLDKGARA